MKKKISLFLLSCLCLTSFAFGVACKGGEETSSPTSSGSDSSSDVPFDGPTGELVVPEEPDALTDPDLKDVTVYKEDIPEGFYIGKGKLLSLTIDGVELPQSKYVVNGGWLVLTAESWEEIGEGECSFTFTFENYDAVTISVTISGEDDTPAIPGSELTAQENFNLWSANSSAVALSYDDGECAVVITKSADTDNIRVKENMVYFNADYIRLAKEEGAVCMQFDYKANTTLAGSESSAFRFFATETTTLLTGGFDSFTATTEWQTATVDIEQFFVANGNVQYFGIVVGGGINSTLTIKNWRLATQEVLNDYRVASLLPNYGFTENNIAKWSVANSAGLKLGWDEEKGMSLTPQVANMGLSSRDVVAYTPVTFMRTAQSAGYEAIAFTVKTDAEFADYIPGTLGGQPLGKGIRVVGKMVDGRDDNSIADGLATGITVYGDFGNTNGITEFTVTIRIKDFFALNKDVKYLGLVAAAGAGISLYLSDLTLVEGAGGDTPTTPDVPDEAKRLMEKYGFNQKNSPSTANGGIWNVNSGGVFGKAWDTVTGTMKITMANANANITGRDFVTYTSIAMLKEAQEAGFTKISFKVTSTDGAFAQEGRGLRLYSKTNEGRAGDGAGVTNSSAYGTYVYKDFGLEAGVTEITVVIDIAEFLALNPNANYLGIVMNMPINTTAYFSELQFLNN